MKRALIVSLAPFLGSATLPVTRQIPDVVEAGRVAATLTDWQTIAFFLIFLLVVGTVERIVAGWQSRATAKQLADAVDRLGLAVHSQGTEIKVALAVIQQKIGGPTMERDG